MNSSRLIVSVPDPDLRDALVDYSAQNELVVWDVQGPAPYERIDLVVLPYTSALTGLSQLASVNPRLVQSQSVGYDGVKAMLPPGLVFANAASVHETSTAELCLALILASQRGIPDFVRGAEKGQWLHKQYESLADRSVLLVGYGGIGKAIESRLLPFETTVTRIARTSRSDERGEIRDLNSLSDLLPRSDIVVVAVPLTEATTHLVDDSFLSMMPNGSLLVNIARGAVADTNALLAHASSGRLRLALDVTDPEPLPPEHPLFFLPNVLISPHVGGASSAKLPRMARLVGEQIARMKHDDDPLNVVLRS